MVFTEDGLKFIQVFNEIDLINQIKHAVVSPMYNLLCFINKLNEAKAYLLPHTNGSSSFWQCSSKSKRCQFSEDGKQLLLLLSVNSIHIHKIEEDGITLLFKINASALADLLLDHGIDYSSMSNVLPLILKRTELLLEVDGRLVCLEWGFLGSEPSVRYTILLPTHKSYGLSQGKLFILLPNNLIVVHNLLNGQKSTDELNPCLASRANADISIGRNFDKFAIDNSSRLLAVVNQDEITILFDISEAFDRPDGKPATPVEGKKDKWSWPGKRKSIFESRPFPGRIISQIEPIHGVVVSKIQFTTHGLFIFFSILGHSDCTSFKIVDVNTGETLCVVDDLIDCELIPGSCLPIFKFSSTVSICMGALSSDSLIASLCNIIPDYGVSGNERLILAKNDIYDADIYANFIKIIFSLHSNVYRKNLHDLTAENATETDSSLIAQTILERLETLNALPLNDENLTAFLFLHLVHLLDLTLLAEKKVTKATVVQLDNLAQTFLRHINHHYSRVRHMDLLRYEWVAWRQTDNQEVVQEAVLLGTVALALVFFTTERVWDVDTAIEKFKEEAKKYVGELISVGDLEKATPALVTLGLEPIEHYRQVCLDTSESLMRDLLVNYLQNEGRFTDDELSAWHFSKKIENVLSSFVHNYRSFDHKMVVSAAEHAQIVMINLIPFKGSLDLNTILGRSLDWRRAVVTELYFCTGDVTLEEQLEKDTCWRYLLDMNNVELLLSWVDVSFDPNFEERQPPPDYLMKMFIGVFSKWKIDCDMLEVASKTKCMTATKCFVLDRSAKYGVFSTSEMNDMAAVVRRLQNLSQLTRVADVLSQPFANVSTCSLYGWVLKESANHGCKLPVLKCLREANIAGSLPKEPTYFSWLEIWRLFELWDGKDEKILLELIGKSSQVVAINPEDKPLLKIASCLLEKKEILEVIQTEGTNGDLLSIPLIDICWQSLQRARTPDVTLYDLLSRSQLPVGRLFAWQTENGYVTEPQVPETFPHFNNQVLSAKFGYRQQLDYMYYLRQGRPSFACNLFIVESLRAHRRLTTKMINRACGQAHGLALRLWNEESVGSACVSFLIMLGDIPTANALRLHLAAVTAVADYVPEDQRKYIGNLTYALVNKDNDLLQDFASLLESTVMKEISVLEPIAQIRKWAVPVTFCNMHGFPLPSQLPRQLAKDKDWFHFILCLDLYKYSYDQAIELIEEMDAVILKAHLLRALTRTTLKLATTSPSKSPPRIRLEPESGGEDVEVKDVFQVFVTNVYTEVLTAIQTFTDRNFVLPWSCEQNPDDDVLLTLLKCESEQDTGRALLLACIELQSPILALLSTCYQVDNVVAPLIAWLLSSLPTPQSRAKLREEAQLFPLDRNVSAEQVQTLLLQFFATGYFQTFYRGMALFLPDNPLTFMAEAIYRSIVELDTESSLRSLKAFVLEMVHFTRLKDAALYSRDWVISTASRLVESILTRPDVLYSSKILFLKLIADAELATVHTVFPKFLLWYQICEILDPTSVRLNFAPLYDLSMVSAEMERCLDELFRIRAFAPALELSALLSLNKDRIIVAIWEEQFEEALVRNDVIGLWPEISSAFKDENVNPSLVAAFFYQMAANFNMESVDSLKNKYLGLKYSLSWRKLVEDTMIPSYREESDIIELEMWHCCLQPEFDHAILQSENSVGLSFSILVSQWPPPKLVIRASTQSPIPTENVVELINTLLDVGDLSGAIRVSAFFSSENQDLMTISSCLQVALGELPVSELSKYSTLLGSPRKLLTVAAPPPAEVDGFEIVRGREHSPILALLERLCSSVVHGSALANRIFVSFRLSSILDISFKDVAAESNYLDLLSRSVTQECTNKMAVAHDIITLANLSDVKLAKFLAEQLVAAVSARLATGLEISAELWGVSLDNGFYQVIAFMQNPSLLGNELLSASATLPYPEGVEMVIRAHDCYTVSCDVEGIGRVLRRSRILAMQILQVHQWRYLVRLLVGVARYADMAYIFQMLKDNDQFEHLLRKSSTKAPGLRLAVSDFLQRTCPENKELGKMVAAYFNLHSNQAEIHLAEADEFIAQLIPPLKDTSKTRQTLMSAMEKYSNASTWYLQAGKMNKALKIAKQAQLVALQISLLGGPYILNLQQTQFQLLAEDSLSVANIQLIARAQDLQVDWIAALYERWIQHGDKTFFSDFRSTPLLTPNLINRFILRYEKEATTGKVKDRIKQLSAMLSIK